MRSSIGLRPASSERVERLTYRRRGLTPTGTQSLAVLTARRLAMAALVAATYGGLAAAFATVLAFGGWSLPEIAMFVCFLISAPWIVVGFWNAVIGLAIQLVARDPMAVVAPCASRAGADDAIRGRVALVMCLRHEDPARAVRRLDAMLRSLDATGHGEAFDAVVLSDSSRPDLVAAEETEIDAWRSSLARPERATYRRRSSNDGFKAGNIREFVETRGRAYDAMITLDADSLMSGEAMLRLVRVLQANPKLGIVQSLVVGLPARTVFARAFQFGMRASVRSYAMGEAWWTGDCGQYWGHNAAIRVKAFRDHAKLPEVPGGPPLGGPVLSHDLYEAVLMRKAGYEVRVLPEEGGSWEENPSTLTEFLRRNLRWCQGNMQYLRLIGGRGLPIVGRVNLAIAILMYAGAPAWIGFMIAGAAQAWDPPAVIGGGAADGAFPYALSTGLLAAMTLILFAPKIMGYLDVMLRPAQRRRYGGVGAFGLGVAAELAFGLLFAPLVSFSVTIFLGGLFLLRRKVGWEAQDREGRRVRLRDAVRQFWPATAFGLALGGSLALSAPEVMFWAAPVLASFVLAAPFAALTSLNAPKGLRLAAAPEEAQPPAEVQALMETDGPVVRYAAPLAPFRFDLAAESRGYSAAASPAE
jgi:membrane glycosyltransferase